MTIRLGDPSVKLEVEGTARLLEPAQCVGLHRSRRGEGTLGSESSVGVDSEACPVPDHRESSLDAGESRPESGAPDLDLDGVVSGVDIGAHLPLEVLHVAVRVVVAASGVDRYRAWLRGSAEVAGDGCICRFTPELRVEIPDCELDGSDRRCPITMPAGLLSAHRHMDHTGGIEVPRVGIQKATPQTGDPFRTTSLTAATSDTV